MPAVWRSRYPAHISRSCSVTHHISSRCLARRPRAPPALPFPSLGRPGLSSPHRALGWGGRGERLLRGSGPALSDLHIFLLAPKQDISPGKRMRRLPSPRVLCAGTAAPRGGAAVPAPTAILQHTPALLCCRSKSLFLDGFKIHGL